MTELILIASSFPLYKGEPFLEKEYIYLNQKFDKIHFIVFTENQSNHFKESKFETHDVTEICYTNSNKFKLLFSSLFRVILWREIGYILSNIKLKYFFSSLKVAIVSLENAKNIKRVINNKISAPTSNKHIIYSYWGVDGAIAGAELADHAKVDKVVTRVHGWDVYFHVHTPPYLPFRSLIQKKCTAIFPISDKGKLTIKNVWKVPDNNVRIARLGVDRQENIDRRHEGIFTLISCSNLIPLKRVHLIAEAVLAINTPIKWVHFGDGNEFSLISDLVKKGKLPHHDITFFGMVDNSEVLDFYRNNRVDLFINLSTTEGIPVSIMEAMSFGIPTLATDVGGTSEIVNEKNGQLLPANITPEELAVRIKAFFELPEEIQVEMRRQALDTWSSKYDAEKNYSHFVDLLVN